MMLRRSKQRKNKTYEEAHLQSTRAFSKATRVLIWAGAFNVVGLMLSVILSHLQNAWTGYFVPDTFFYNNLGVNTTTQFVLCLSSNSLIFRLLETITQDFNKFSDGILSPTWLLIIEMIITVSFSGFCVFVSLLSFQGKKWAFYAQVIFYTLDTLLIIPIAILGEPTNFVLINLGVHILVMLVIGFMVYEYCHILAIERKYKSGYNQSTSNTEENKESGNQNVSK